MHCILHLTKFLNFRFTRSLPGQEREVGTFCSLPHLNCEEKPEGDIPGTLLVTVNIRTWQLFEGFI